jgi:hypothetical protein
MKGKGFWGEVGGGVLVRTVISPAEYQLTREPNPTSFLISKVDPRLLVGDNTGP